MRLRIAFFFLALLSLAYAAEDKLTITGYFITFNDEDMPDGLKTGQEREAALKRKAGSDETIGRIVQDDKNGYLALGFKTRQQSVRHEYAVWRLPGDTPVLGMNSLYSGAGGITGTVRFVKFVKSGVGFVWQDANEEVFADFKQSTFQPKPNAPAGCKDEPPLAQFPENFSCKLPQKGLTVVCQFNLNCDTPTKLTPKDFYAKPVVKFEWKKDRFVAK